MEEHLPLTLLREAQSCSAIEQFIQIRLITERAADSVRGNKACQKDKQEGDREDSEETVGSQ